MKKFAAAVMLSGALMVTPLATPTASAAPAQVTAAAISWKGPHSRLGCYAASALAAAARNLASPCTKRSNGKWYYAVYVG